MMTLTVGDLIRIGAAQTDPIRGSLVRRDLMTDEITKACAYGAYRLAVAQLDPDAICIHTRGLASVSDEKVLSTDNIPRSVCPTEFLDEIRHTQKYGFWKVVTTLNDECGWSREEIAEWADKATEQGHLPTFEFPDEECNALVEIETKTPSGDSVPEEPSVSVHEEPVGHE